MAFSEPIVACFVYEGICYGVLSDGRWFTNPDEDLYAEAPGAYLYEDISTGEFTRAQFTTNGAGVFLVGKSTNPSKLTVFKIGDSDIVEKMARKWQEETVGNDSDWLPENSTTIQDNGQIACIAEDCIIFPNRESFKESGSVARKDLARLAWDSGMRVSFDNNGNIFVWGCAAKGSRDLAIYRITPDYQVAASTIIENALSTESRTSVNNRDGMAGRQLALSPGNRAGWPAADRAVIMDAQTLETTLEVPATDKQSIEAVSLGSDTILLCEVDSGGLSGHYRLVGIEDGSDKASDLEEYSYRTRGGLLSDFVETSHYYEYIQLNRAAPATDAEGKTVALACADGVLRTFNLADGHLLWESPDSPTQVEYLTILPETGNILLQDAEGRCSLLSGDNGQLIAKTMTSLSPIQRSIYAIGDDFAVQYRDGTWRAGVALICVDADNFGPIADVPKGVAFSREAKSFLVNNFGTYSLHPIHNLESALLFARTLVKTSGSYDEIVAAQETREAAAASEASAG